VTDRDALIPARDINRIGLNDILAVVRREGETGSYDEPHWEPDVAALGKSLDDAVSSAIHERTLADLLDSAERGEVS